MYKKLAKFFLGLSYVRTFLVACQKFQKREICGMTMVSSIRMLRLQPFISSAQSISLLRSPRRHSPLLTISLSTATTTGSPIPGLDFLKDNPAPILRDPLEYPKWVGEIVTKPLPTLARLQKMEVEDATDKEQYRYLKLTRRNSPWPKERR